MDIPENVETVPNFLKISGLWGSPTLCNHVGNVPDYFAVSQPQLTAWNLPDARAAQEIDFQRSLENRGIPLDTQSHASM